MADPASVPNFGIEVPKTGSHCSNCQSFRSTQGQPFCANADFIRFMGEDPHQLGFIRIPARDGDPDRYCCNAYSPDEGTLMSHRLDLGPGDVHIPSAGRSEKTHMATLKAKKRNSMRDPQFADPEERKYPVHDKAHADNAAARLEQQKGSMSPDKYRRIKAKIRAAQRRFGEKPKTDASMTPGRTGRGLRMAMVHPDGTRYEVRHMSAAYHEQSGVLYLHTDIEGVQILAAKDGEAAKRVWVQIARVGQWKGHPQGPFKLDSQIFDSLVRNFKTQTPDGIQWDFNHASEMPPNSGTIPAMGTPAVGWIHDLKHDGRALYALTEWKPLAAEYVRNGEYQGASPAIHWKMKDRVSGEPVGPVLTSVALTNAPFITGMRAPTAASAFGVEGSVALEEDAETEEAEESILGYSAYAYSTGEYMPGLKAALRLAPGATPQEVGEHFDRLRGKYDESGGDLMSMHDGYCLSDFMTPIRDLVRPPLGTTWDDLLDMVDDRIAEAIEEHEELYHPDGPPDAVAASATPSEEEPQTMTTPNTDTTEKDKLLASAQADVAAKDAALKAKDAEIDALKKENTALLSWKTEREERDIDALVTTAIQTWGSKKGIDESKRSDLKAFAKTAPQLFAAQYPPVDADKRHLLHTFTGDGRQPANGAPPAPRAPADNANGSGNGSEPQLLGLRALSMKIAAEKKLPLNIAQLEAEKIIRARKLQFA